MKEIRICQVCGAKFVKLIRKDSNIDVCSLNYRQKYHTRIDAGLPVNNVEFEKGRSERRKKADLKRLQTMREKGSLEAASLCKRKECKYRMKTSGMYTCDYMLITGHRRGCPVENCNKYDPGRHPIVQPM